jgi:AraC family transcriptional regulator
VHPETGIALPHSTLRSVLRFVRDNLDAKLTWADMAAHAGMEHYQFGRWFKRTTGLTPHQFVIRKRLRRARAMLTQQHRSLADVALDVGCSCQSHLTTLFRRHLDITPGAFRREAHTRSGNENAG